MKNYTKVIVMLMATVFLVMDAFIISNSITTKEEKHIRVNNNTRIILEDSDFMSEGEQQQLDNLLKSNKSVLLIFNESSYVGNPKNIISKYTEKDDVPYVIFTYNKDTRTLNVATSGVNINNTYVDNITYSVVYTYLPHIHSEVMVRYITQHKVEFIFVLLPALCILLFLIATIILFYGDMSWHDGQTYFQYRRTFLEKIKVRLSKNASNVKIYAVTNVPPKNGEFTLRANDAIIKVVAKRVHYYSYYTEEKRFIEISEHLEYHFNENILSA